MTWQVPLQRLPLPAYTGILHKMIIVLFGVAGSGKTTVGKLLAKYLGWLFVDADDHHSLASIAKMNAGTPLDDDDRREWLLKLRTLIEAAVRDGQDIILACSALKTAYRETLRMRDEVRFVFLDSDFGTIQKRLAERKGHFMDPRLLQSQFDILETKGLVDLVLDASVPPEDCAAQIRAALVGE